MVTGAGGFIGSRLCPRLVEGGFDVHATSRTSRRDADDGVRWRQLDLADPGAVRDALDAVNPDVVVHLASHVAGARQVALVLPTFQANLASTVNLLAATAERGHGRIVIAGSMEEPEHPGDVPASPYAAAKWASAAYARMFDALFATDVVTLRIFMVYGPGRQDLRKLVPYVSLALMRGEQPRLSSGSRPVDWVYVDDVVDALVAAAAAEGVAGSTIDVGSGVLVPVAEIVERLVELTDARVTPLLGALDDRPLETVRRADLEPAARLLGWQPATSLDEGLARTVAWFASTAGQAAVAAGAA